MAFDFSIFENEEDGFFANEEDRMAAEDFREETPDVDDEFADNSDDFEDYSEYLGEGKNFAPKPKNWKKSPFTELPNVTVDAARHKFWEHGKKEIRYIRDKVLALHDRDRHAKNPVDTVVNLLGGPKSDLYHTFTKVMPNSGYNDFAEWLGAFFFSSQMGKNYTKLSKSERVDCSDFVSAKEYNHVWREMEAYAKGNPFLKRSWNIFQDALNATLQEKFLSKPKELMHQVCLDDDKALEAYTSLRNVPVDEDSELSRQHHVKDNRKGFTCHCACFAASGIPLRVAFQKAGYGTFDTVVELFRGLYNSDNPDLTGVAALNADRGYLRINLLTWWLLMGGHVLGTVMRQEFLPFTFGKTNEQAAKLGQQNIPTDTQKVVHQATLKHNFGKSSNQNHCLTCTAYSSGISSTVNLAIHSEHHERQFDMVCANPADWKWWFDRSLTPYERRMHGFQLIAGEPDPMIALLEECVKNLEEDHEDDSDDPNETLADRTRRVRNRKQEIIENHQGHGESLLEEVWPKTVGTLDASWWAHRAMLQTSSNAYGQIRVLTPTIGTNHDLRGDWEMIAEYGIEYDLMVEMLSNSFLKPLRRGNEEGMSKYTLAGQRAEEPILKEWFDAHHQRDKTVSLYRPGLVSMVSEDLVRDSADAVIVDQDEDGDAIHCPVEVKARVSKNTFHRQCKELDVRSGVERWDPEMTYDTEPRWVSVEGTGQYNYLVNIGEDKKGNPLVHPHLHKLVPETKELMQCLHHAYVYGQKACILVIGDKRSFLGSIIIEYPDRLIEAYGNILKHCRERCLGWAIGPDDGMPNIPDLVFEALKADKLKRLNMSDDAFRCFFGLWRVLNGFGPKEKWNKHNYPLPRIARIVPFNVAAWNVLKGGSDTITKLIEICKEKLGVRSENNIALARLLLYFAVTFHRLNQILTGSDPDDYPTMLHWRHAANERFSFAESLELFCDRLIILAKGDAHVRRKPQSMPNPTGVYAPSPTNAANATSGPLSTTEATPELQKMPPGRTITGTTPGKGGSLDLVHEEFHLRSERCLGIFLAKREAAPEDEEESDGLSDEGSKEDGGSTKPRLRKKCHICKQLTPFVCHGCGRSLCLKAPKKAHLVKIVTEREKKRKKKNNKRQKGGKSGKASTGGGTKKKKTATNRRKRISSPKMIEARIRRSYPDTFCVEVPVTVNGQVQMNRYNEPKLEKEFGEYTCYHIAHHEAWKKYLYQTQQEVIDQLCKSLEGTPEQKGKKKRRETR